MCFSLRSVHCSEGGSLPRIVSDCYSLWRPETSLFGCQGNLINKYHQCSCWLSWVSCKLGSLVGKCLDCACLQVSVMQWESSLKSYGTCSHLSCYHGMLYLSLLVTTKQKHIVDTQKERKKESKHNTKDNRWATRGECSCSLDPDSKQGSVTPPELFCFSKAVRQCRDCCPHLS